MQHNKNIRYSDNFGTMPEFQKILISRTDAIGDVCLTLPVCQALAAAFPDAELTYLCRSYTRSVVACFEPIDHILTLEYLDQASENERDIQLSRFDVVIHLFPNRLVAQWCKQAQIPLRIGTSHRFFHLFTCNRRPNFSRKRSDLHESQLNFKLLSPLGLTETPSFLELSRDLNFKAPELTNEYAQQDWSKTVLLHPKSNGSGVEYPLEKYIELAMSLISRGYHVCFTGTEHEGIQFRAHLPKHPSLQDVSGKWDLSTFIAVISKSKALVACSTGPYHLAGLTGIRAIGLFASRKPIHAGRWAALGIYSKALEYDPSCKNCAEGRACSCVSQIQIERIIDAIEN
jgi:heptosyltransferase-3